MAKAFEILEDKYCFECSNVTPTEGTAGAPVNFSFDSASGNGDATLTGVTALINDGTSETATLTGTSGTFSHTFATAGTYTVTLVSTYSSTSIPSECGPYTIVIA